MNAIKLGLVAATTVVCVACGSTGAGPSPPASSAPCGPPKLTILEPVPGQTVRAPAQVQFRVDCFRLGPSPAGHIHAWAGPPGSSQRFELRPSQRAGVVEISDPLLSGERTLTFQLANADHTPVPNPEARVVVPDVVFEGP
jgi:hypothetical protein